MKPSKTTIIAILATLTNPFAMFAAIEFDKNNYWLAIPLLLVVIGLDFIAVKNWFRAQVDEHDKVVIEKLEDRAEALKQDIDDYERKLHDKK